MLESRLMIDYHVKVLIFSTLNMCKCFMVYVMQKFSVKILFNSTGFTSIFEIVYLMVTQLFLMSMIKFPIFCGV